MLVPFHRLIRSCKCTLVHSTHNQLSMGSHLFKFLEFFTVWVFEFCIFLSFVIIWVFVQYLIFDHSSPSKFKFLSVAKCDFFLASCIKILIFLNYFVFMNYFLKPKYSFHYNFFPSQFFFIIRFSGIFKFVCVYYLYF